MKSRLQNVTQDLFPGELFDRAERNFCVVYRYDGGEWRTVVSAKDAEQLRRAFTREHPDVEIVSIL